MMINIGDILRALGLISRAQLDKALAAQRADPGKKRLGQILVEQKAVKPEQVDSCLAKQDDLQRLKVSTADAAKLADYAAQSLLDKADINDPEFDGLTGLIEREKQG